MSRLIDADEVKKAFIGNRYGTKAIEYVIDSVPTVKAIPIEWIENIIYANKYLWEQNKERMFVDQGVVKVINYSMTAQILSELIDRWEKENERDQISEHKE